MAVAVQFERRGDGFWYEKQQDGVKKDVLDLLPPDVSKEKAIEIMNSVSINDSGLITYPDSDLPGSPIQELLTWHLSKNEKVQKPIDAENFLKLLNHGIKLPKNWINLF